MESARQEYRTRPNRDPTDFSVSQPARTCPPEEDSFCKSPRSCAKLFLARGFSTVQSIEVWHMTKKMIFALFGLVVAFALVTPPTASAQVRVGVGVAVPYGGYVVGCDPYYYPAGCYGTYGYWGGPFIGVYGGGYGWGGRGFYGRGGYGYGRGGRVYNYGGGRGFGGGLRGGALAARGGGFSGGGRGFAGGAHGFAGGGGHGGGGGGRGGGGRR